jgi:hypothetical protein
MDLAAQHPGRQPCFIRLGAIGAVRPHIAANVVRADYMAQHPAITVGRGRHGATANEAIATIDGDMRLVAECRDRNHWRWRSVGAVTHLAADLQCPAAARQGFACKAREGRICVLLGSLVRFIQPYLIRGLARLDRRLLILRRSPVNPAR